jgi:hypothetical protein
VFWKSGCGYSVAHEFQCMHALRQHEVGRKCAEGGEAHLLVVSDEAAGGCGQGGVGYIWKIPEPLAVHSCRVAGQERGGGERGLPSAR